MSYVTFDILPSAILPSSMKFDLIILHIVFDFYKIVSECIFRRYNIYSYFGIKSELHNKIKSILNGVKLN